MLYMVGLGFEQGTCALVGQQIGKNDPAEARVYFNSFKYVASIVVIVLIIIVYTLRVEIVSIYTDIESIHNEALKVMVLYVIH